MPNVYRDIERCVQQHGRIAVATVIRQQGSVPRGVGAKMIVCPDGTSLHSVGGGLFEAIVITDALEVIRTGQWTRKTYSFNEEGRDAIGVICGGVAEVMIEMISLSPQLMIIGGGHVGQAILQFARHLDFRMVLADDRKDFAQSRVPDVSCYHVRADYQDLPAPEENAFVCLVTKGFVSDEAALRRVIRLPLSYLGMIGSQKKIQRVYGNMQKDGFEPELFEKVRAPIGLEIGADTPEEIAVSVLAEIIKVRNSRE